MFEKFQACQGGSLAVFSLFAAARDGPGTDRQVVTVLGTVPAGVGTIATGSGRLPGGVLRARAGAGLGPAQQEIRGEQALALDGDFAAMLKAEAIAETLVGRVGDLDATGFAG